MSEIPDGPKHTVEIHIDQKLYKVPEAALTGAELRRVAEPPIGSDRDLWLEVPGAPDQLIADGEIVELKNGMHFFSAPRTINPGVGNHGPTSS